MIMEARSRIQSDKAQEEGSGLEPDRAFARRFHLIRARQLL